MAKKKKTNIKSQKTPTVPPQDSSSIHLQHLNYDLLHEMFENKKSFSCQECTLSSTPPLSHLASLSVCLSCCYIGCMKNNNKYHLYQHFQKENHYLYLSFNTGMIWCYHCNQTSEFLVSASSSEQNALFAQHLIETREYIMNCIYAVSSRPVLLSSFHPLLPHGLDNIGSTCYFNSVMQNLNATLPLVEYYLNHNIDQAPLAKQLTHFFNDMNSSSKSTHFILSNNQNLSSLNIPSINPNNFYTQFSSLHPKFRRYVQQDSHEFLLLLFHSLIHEKETFQLQEGVKKAHLIFTKYSEPEITEWFKEKHQFEIDETLLLKLHSNNPTLYFNGQNILNFIRNSKTKASKSFRKILTNSTQYFDMINIFKDVKEGVLDPQSKDPSPSELKPIPHILEQLFQGSYESTLQCQRCLSCYSHHDTFFNISLSISPPRPFVFQKDSPLHKYQVKNVKEKKKKTKQDKKSQSKSTKTPSTTTTTTSSGLSAEGHKITPEINKKGIKENKPLDKEKVIEKKEPIEKEEDEKKEPLDKEKVIKKKEPIEKEEDEKKEPIEKEKVIEKKELLDKEKVIEKKEPIEKEEDEKKEPLDKEKVIEKKEPIEKEEDEKKEPLDKEKVIEKKEPLDKEKVIEKKEPIEKEEDEKKEPLDKAKQSDDSTLSSNEKDLKTQMEALTLSDKPVIDSKLDTKLKESTIPSVHPLSKDVVTLDDCFSSYTDKELLTGQNKFICQICNSESFTPPPPTNSDEATSTEISSTPLKSTNIGPLRTEAIKQLLFSHLPPYLIIHFKRFHQNGHHISKDDKKVDFPYLIDLSSYMIKEDIISFEDLKIEEKETFSTSIYELYGIIVHNGQLTGGHYYCYTFHDQYGWICLNDRSVKPLVTLSPQMKNNAYILFYRQKK